MRTRTAPLAAAAAITACLALLVRATVRRYAVAEESMSPALEPGDWVLAMRSVRSVRGDIVVFAHPHRPGFTLVKRIVGLPGETITIRDGGVAADGRHLDEPWARGVTSPEGTWTLGPGELFVLSDARTRTLADGRSFGPIPRSAAAWTVRARYRPVARIGRVR